MDFYERASSLCNNEDWDELLVCCNESLDKLPADHEYRNMLQFFRARAYEKLKRYQEARRCYFPCINICWGDTESSKLIYERFKDVDKRLSKQLLKLPYSERKVIMPVKEFSSLDKISSFIMLRINAIPQVEFPVGHPIANTLYVGHPYYPAKYMPFETYQLELIEEKVREFCMLAQCLGATEISIECLNSNNSDSSGDSRTQVKCGGKYGVFEAKAEGEFSYAQRLIKELSQSISLNQTYSPFKEPHLPKKGLVWYPNEPSWQQLYSQRMKGGLISHEERIEIKKSQMVDNNELSKLKAEIGSFFAGINIEMTNEEKEKYSQQENAVLAIKVKFASMKEIQNNRETHIDIPYDDPEEKKDLKERILEGGTSVQDRIVTIFKTGTSKLKTLFSPKLSEGEQEYYNEYKEIIEDGEISARDQRFLNKIKTEYGITDERAKEIEEMAMKE